MKRLSIVMPVLDEAAGIQTTLHHLAALRARGHTLDTLSMGMSADLEAAILEGATIVRVGTALFGERTKHA